MRVIRQNIKQIISFGVVGLINTVVGTVVMFSMYNCLGFGYWISTAANYIVGSIWSYLLNKKFTFNGCLFLRQLAIYRFIFFNCIKQLFYIIGIFLAEINVFIM